MKKVMFLLVVALVFGLVANPATALAQTETPPEALTGEVVGKIINKNQNAILTEVVDVMLHIWDKDNVDLGIEHGQSDADGTFRFTSVVLESGRTYAVMATYEGVTYFSDVVLAEPGTDRLELEVPVYETTTDTSKVQVDQMHVLFDFAEDGMETTEIYILSNLGERTLKDAIILDDGQPATLMFPLPADADFIFFQPDQQDRFVKFPGGFADTYPLMPGERSEQIIVKYLVPFSEGQTYTYNAPINIQNVNLLLPENAGLSLQGAGLSDPQPFTLQNGSSYQVFSYTDIRASQTLEISFSGKPKLGDTNQRGIQTSSIALGGVLLGLALVGVGVWWWRRPEDVIDEDADGEVDVLDDNTELDDIIAEIARLDEVHERGGLDEEEYQTKRMQLRQEAKALLDRLDRHICKDKEAAR